MTASKTYTKRPVNVQAMEWTGDNFGAIVAFATSRAVTLGTCGVLRIETLEGTMRAGIGDMIIRGVNGEFYPCKADIFAKTYVEASE